ncbi:MAG: formate dehydrogenase accessory protein FdhE [Roseiflexaceae bacterium]
MKFFRRSEPARLDLASALDRLDRLGEGDPSLRDAAALQSAILRVIYRSPPPVGTIELAVEHARDKLHSGVPLLHGEPVPLDIAATRSLLLELCRTMQQSEARSGSASAIATAVDHGILDVAGLVAAVLNGQAAGIREQATALEIDGELLCTLLRFSLLPALEQLATQLAPLRALAAWQPGYCPTCGSWPLLGEYRGLDQARFLRCGLCTTEWSLDRLLCPFCGCRDHQQLGYLHIEGDQQKRATTCGQCRCYNKTLATLAAIPPIELAVDDLATIHLDMIALKHGYLAPT